MPVTFLMDCNKREEQMENWLYVMFIEKDLEHARRFFDGLMESAF